MDTPHLLVIIIITLTSYPKSNGFTSPFFMFCNNELTSGDQSDFNSEIALTLTIEGNPEYYDPGKVYQMKITSNQDFDGFQINAVFAMTSDMALPGQMASMPFYGASPLISPQLQSSEQSPNKRFMCSRQVHAHFGYQPQREMQFMWMAPPKGNGCISFKGTATRDQQILFNSVTILHLCEKGSKIDFSNLHEEGVIVRDDFDSSRDFDADIWGNHEGMKISSECGVLLHGKAAVACMDSGVRQLITVPINLTTASVLQFAVASGSCKSSAKGEQVILSYGTNDCSNWTAFSIVLVQKQIEAEVHIIHLPIKARRNDICLKFAELNSSDSSHHEGCWSLDNVAIVNLADPPRRFEDGFDPVDLNNWLFFPGAQVQVLFYELYFQHQCLSDQKALVFDNDEDTRSNSATTRDINLEDGLSRQNFIFSEDYESKDNLVGWQIDGGGPSTQCGDTDADYHMLFREKSKTRRLCTPYIDMSRAGNVRFSFTFGDRDCSKGATSQAAQIYVYVEDQQGHSSSLSTLKPQSHQVPREVSLTLSEHSRMPNARVCWTQKSHHGSDWDVWVLDDIYILMSLPQIFEYFVQFELNLNCEQHSDNISVVLEFTTNHGSNWEPLFEECTNLQCYTTMAMTTAYFHSDQYHHWTRITLPLPHAAMAKYTRFRWSQLNGFNASWALDNVYIGNCTSGCNNHGKCTQQGCVCDAGYHGDLCEQPDVALPSFLIEDLSSSTTNSFRSLHGMESLGYTCGIIATQKSLVFNQNGTRSLETIDMNTSNAKYLQYSIRIGSDSMVGLCPPPDNPEEVVLLHYTCDGGVTWTLLQELPTKEYTQPVMLSLLLPDEARGAMCRFQWWQPLHSGQGHDVWAIDDISVTSAMYNTIDLQFETLEEGQQAIEIHLGELNPYCSRQHVLSFAGPYQEGESRNLVTRSMRIGSSYIIQFDLVMGCDNLFVLHLDNVLYLEYSTNHGMTWALVQEGCWMPRMCQEYHTASVYYPSQYQKWRRIIIPLPSHTWSSSTRLRLRQEFWSFSDSWAIDNLYIGLQCPHMCHGHGYCKQAQCMCDEGYSGPSCTPHSELPSTLSTDFSLMSQLHHDWLFVLGGELAGANQGCGTMLSGESLFFFKAGPRQLVSRHLNTTRANFLEFYIQLGGHDDIQCFGIETRQENILVQYSTDGGITWWFLKELQGPDYFKPSLVHLDLPTEACGESVQFRWWQPSHSGVNTDQWAIDQIQLSSYLDITYLEDDFEVHDEPRPIYHDLWQLLTEPMFAPYCGSTDDALMLANQPNDKIAMTKDLRLSPGDMIQFWINVGCSKTFSPDNPVLLEYSHDSGMSWWLVEEPCYQSSVCHNKFTQGSVYYTGPYGEWKPVILSLSEAITKHRVNIRWWQPGGSMSSFALNNVYIGPPCPAMCSGHGVCVHGLCQCDNGYGEKECLPLQDEPLGMVDRFEDTNLPGELWDNVLGAYLGIGCGVIGSGNSLYFHGEGPREARTVPVNTTNIRLLQFTIRIGNPEDKSSCSRPKDRMEGVIVDYTRDNGISWDILKLLDPELYMDEPAIVSLTLPLNSKSETSVIRWWQPLILNHPRAEWAIDDVIIAVNDTSKLGFQENFNPMKPDVWYNAMNAVPRITCQSQDNALEFSKNGQMRYAETWDYQVTPSTFLQFYIAMGCSGTYSTLYNVKLQYSIDMGHSWHSVMEECLPPKTDCSGYHLSSNLVSEAHANWTRVTLYLPTSAVTPATRFRWLQETVTLRGNVWALDNIYLGEGCPWMCSGHGYCDQGTCICDPGYFGVYCVPLIELPMTLRDDFDHGLRHDLWPEVYGGEVTNICGLLIYGNSLTFYKDNLRMAVTRELDVSMVKFIQFYFDYGCEPVVHDWPRQQTVLLQFSTNGGIVWNLLEDMHHIPVTGIKFFSILLPGAAQTNATNFRFWQPQHDGHMKSVWSIDNVFVGGSVVNSDSLIAIMDSEPNHLDWHFWPGGLIDHYCTFNTRGDTLLTSPDAMVFRKSAGEHSITTRDLSVNDVTVIQFEINIGCTSQVSKDHPVRLEYSVDYGRTWLLVVPPCTETTMACERPHPDATVYFSGATKYWQRVVVILKDLKICGTARFRWYQGLFQSAGRNDVIPEWAIKNIYIGVQCQHHCLGHGTCIYGVLCQCDDNYGGESCEPTRPNPAFIKEDFDRSDVELSSSKWLLVSGGERTRKCGTLAHGNSLHFISHGVRVLSTVDLDLNVATFIQFFLRLGCSNKHPNPRAQPVHLQFSKNGGIVWETLQQFVFGPDSNKVQYIALDISQKMQGPATRIRWWQAADKDDTFIEEWAIEEIYIGGTSIGRLILLDDLNEPSLGPTDNWLLTPGAVIEPACGLNTNTLHFSGDGESRYAITNDVRVTEATYMQFYLIMGCISSIKCYAVQLEYSVDFGKTWLLVAEDCPSTGATCTSYQGHSVYQSDVYADWTRVTIDMPYYTRTKATRFRFIQLHPFEIDNTWAISNVYVGDECKCSCSGRGQCVKGNCVCDKGWIGDSCSDTVSPLPTLLMDSFTDGTSDKYWQIVNGAIPTTECGVLSSGAALHFKGGCTRQLVSADLDLRQAIYIQFNFRFGCLSPPTSRKEGVFLDYSRNGGKTWSKIIELFYDQYKNGSYVTIDVPTEAKENGVRIRLWQPYHSGESKGDWAVDNIVIGGRQSNSVHLQDTFSDAPAEDLWLQLDNIIYAPYCGSDDSVMGTPKTKESVVLMTTDISVEKDSIIQFSISIGCNASWDSPISPVHLEYSTDYGIKWHHLEDECLPYLPHCHGSATTSSVFYTNPGWRRVTYFLEGPVISKQTRFRWWQPLMLEPMEPYRQHWALDDVYIGAACQQLCSGHGLCLFPRCHCDPGYGGVHCEENKPAQTYLKDTFNEPVLAETQWLEIQGGNITMGCKQLVEGTALHFSGPGHREIVTVDLDLRDARFVQYHALIGGFNPRRMDCGTPKTRNENVFLQYSTDSGTTWHLLHQLDYQTYWIKPHRDYITLPLDARTKNTRLRWWQPHGQNSKQPLVGWTLDNVFIGGNEINPSWMLETFQGDQTDTLVEFSPGGVLGSGICGKRDQFMKWESDGSLITQQMIIQDSYMLQFKIMIGCGDATVDECDIANPVRLEYRRDPASDVWDIVYPRCVLNSHETNMECTPYSFSSGSIFSVDSYQEWSRVTLRLPPKVLSGQTQLRWIRPAGGTPGPSWALDDIYIGEQCLEMCHGRGECLNGQCHCDTGYDGPTCKVGRLPLRLSDGFEGGISSSIWLVVEGGGLGMGCGHLSPWAHGKNLYFSGCGNRQAITMEIDTSKATKIMFVIQIGSGLQTSTCNIDLSLGPGNGMVVLQYTTNKGIGWNLVATHAPSEFLIPKKVGYNIPHDAMKQGVQFRWWQPEHQGAARDQWAIDDVEIITTRQDQMRSPDSKPTSNTFPWSQSRYFMRL